MYIANVFNEARRCKQSKQIDTLANTGYGEDGLHYNFAKPKGRKLSSRNCCGETHIVSHGGIVRPQESTEGRNRREGVSKPQARDWNSVQRGLAGQK